MKTLGSITAIVGAIIYWISNSGATQCSSALVRAFNANECQSYDNWHTAGIIMAIAGIVLLLIGAINSTKRKENDNG